MIKFHLEKYHQFLKIESLNKKRYIWDPIRKDYFVLQPEEIVRQSWILGLHHHFEINYATMSVEKQLIVNGQKKRFDLLLYKKSKPVVLCEFKSYNVRVSDKTAEQIANYNLALEVPYLIISNGLSHYAFHQDYTKSQSREVTDFDFLSRLFAG